MAPQNTEQTFHGVKTVGEPFYTADASSETRISDSRCSSKSAFMFFRRYAIAISRSLKTEKGSIITLIFTDDVSIAKISN